MTPYIWAIALVSISLSAIAQLLMKVGMTHVGSSAFAGNHFLAIATNPYVISGFVCYGIGALLWLKVLSRTPLSLAYPLVSLAFVEVAVLSWLVFGESFTAGRIIGIALIVTGVVLMGALSV